MGYIAPSYSPNWDGRQYANRPDPHGDNSYDYMENHRGGSGAYAPVAPVAPSIAAQQQAAIPSISDIDPRWSEQTMPYDSFPVANYTPRTTEISYPGNSGATAPPPGGTPGNYADYEFTQQRENDPFANDSSSPGILYQMQQYRPPTLQDYGQNIGRGLNNWLMNSYVTAPSDIYQQTNDAWASQLNANARNQNFNNLLQMMGDMFNSNGNGGSGFRDTHSRQAANSNGSYTTSIDAGGMNPQLAQNAVTAMQNAHPGGARGNLGFTDPQSQHADLRRNAASNSANDLNRMMAQGYAGMEDRRDAGRAGEGTGIMGYQANQRIRNNNQRANFASMMMNHPLVRNSIGGY